MRRFAIFSREALLASAGDSESALDAHAKRYGVKRSAPADAPELRVITTYQNQTPAQYAECFGYTLVPPQAWEQKHMRAAQALVDGGADPNRIALFVVPGGVSC